MGMTRAEISKKIDEIIDFSEIEQFVDTPVKRYSSGMYVKLAFAVASNLDPDILICDEVLAVGDVAFQQKCLGKMGDVARGGRAVIYVSHNLRTVSQLCTRAVYLEHGRLTYDGEVARAMDLYAGAGMRSVDRDLDSIPRGKGRGNTMRMLRMSILDSQTMEYEQDSSMRFSIAVRARAGESACRLRVVLMSNNAAPVAMAQSEAFPVEPDSEFFRAFTVDLSRVAPGEYGIRLQLVGQKPNGKSINHDTVEDAGHFIITENAAANQGFLWNEPAWGNHRLPELRMEVVD
jgi:lipopolysaccharide transport system ATP-binding protein